MYGECMRATITLKSKIVSASNFIKMKRVVIYPKDIMIITGKSERYSRYLIQRIKKHLNKENHQIVSITEFCEYMGLQIDEVESCII